MKREGCLMNDLVSKVVEDSRLYDERVSTGVSS